MKVDVVRLVELTAQTTPDAATHWSARKMSAVLGVSASASASAVMRHWQAHGLKPYLVRAASRSRATRSSPTSSKTSWACTVSARARPGAVLRREKPGACAGSRGVFTSVAELVAAIDDYVAHRNAAPKPFIWTKSARDVLQRVIRANARVSSKQNETLH